MQRTFLIGQGLGIAMLLAVLLGCGQPQVAPGNLRLTMALRTALSARNGDWLASCREQIESRRQAAEISDAEYAKFISIVVRAENGEWDAAERAVVTWQKGQRPPG